MKIKIAIGRFAARMLLVVSALALQNEFYTIAGLAIAFSFVNWLLWETARDA